MRRFHASSSAFRDDKSSLFRPKDAALPFTPEADVVGST